MFRATIGSIRLRRQKGADGARRRISGANSDYAAFTSVLARKDGAVLTVSLNRPAQRNAINGDVHESLRGIFALAVARELERSGRKVSFVGAIETPFAALDVHRRSERILQGLVFEIVCAIAGDRLP